MNTPTQSVESSTVDPQSAESESSALDSSTPLMQAEPGPVAHRCDVLIAAASQEVV